jgi:deazaflavin-dependent oxidoreductase (nitroreductase family)
MLALRVRDRRWTTIEIGKKREEGSVMANFSEVPWIAAHIELYRTDPEKAHMWDSSPLGGPGLLPTLLLTTTGRKSGEKRSLPLIYGEHGDAHVVIASKGGMPNHPIWFLNLEADPDCELMVGPRRIHARARVATGEERERLWQKMAAIYPPYDKYQETAGARTIPVVVLEPAD